MTGTDAKQKTKPDQLKPFSFASATTNTNTTTLAATATASKDYTFGTTPLVPAPAPAPAASFGGFASTAASFGSPVTKTYSFGARDILHSKQLRLPNRRTCQALHTYMYSQYVPVDV